MPLPESLARSRYALLRSYRRDGSPVDTPIWFAAEPGGHAIVFRTKWGPKTTRLRGRNDVTLTPCDHRGRIIDPETISGSASILSGTDAEEANCALHRRYGWQWNTVPLLKIPGVTSVHAGLSFREKWRRARSRTLWADSAIVRVDVNA